MDDTTVTVDPTLAALQAKIAAALGGKNASTSTATTTTPDPATKPDDRHDATAAAVALATTAVATVIAPVTPLQAVAAAEAGGAAVGSDTGATAAVAAIGSSALAAAGAQAAAGQKTAGLVPNAPTPDTDAAAGASGSPAANPTPDAGASAQAQLAAGIQSANASQGTQVAADAQNTGGPHAPARPGTDTTAGAQGGANHADGIAGNQASQPATFAANLPTQPGAAAPANGQAAATTVPVANAAGSAAGAGPAPTAAASAQTGAANTGAIPLAAVPVEIAARAQAGSNSFEIRLDPPDLGRIDVQLNVDKQGNVTSHLIADKSSTLDMLQRNAPQLQRALQDAGLKTSSDTLQFSLRDQGTNAQSQQQQSFHNNGATRTAQIALPTDDVQPLETTRSYGRLYGVTGGLDIRV